MRLSVCRHLQRLAPRYYNKTKLGDLVSRITRCPAVMLKPSSEPL
jgi:ABC-type multidrug transport system fused ATPase/permease subunit